MSINSLQLNPGTRHTEIVAKHRARLEERLAKVDTAQVSNNAIMQGKMGKAEEKIAVKMSEENQPTAIQNQSSFRKVTLGQMQELARKFMESIGSEEYRANQRKQIDESLAKLKDKPNRLMSEFGHSDEWKADRKKVGLFSRYEEAGDKVQMPARYKVPGPNSTEPFEQWTDETLRKQYGNYFVYKMERDTGEIMTALESIGHHEDSVEANQKLLAERTDPREKLSTERFIEASQSEIIFQEQKIGNTLERMYGWAESNGVLEDTKLFIQEFSRDYYGNEQNMDALLATYGIV